MSDALRRFRNHPIYSTVGALYATLLIGLTALLWLGTLVQIAHGRAIPGNARLALALVSILGAWYMNFMTVAHRLRRLDPAAYAVATRDMGFIAYLLSTRTSALSLHHALAGLDLKQFPWSFRVHVRGTLLLNVLLLWGTCLLILGVALYSKHLL